MLSLFNGQAYLTTNIICTDKMIYHSYKMVEHEREELLHQADKTVNSIKHSL